MIDSCMSGFLMLPQILHLAADFKKLGKAAGIGESVDDVGISWKECMGDWLLIFDKCR